MQTNLLKIAVAVLLILLAGGAWMALDYMNRQEQLQAKSLQTGLMQAQLEAKSRNRMQANIEAVFDGYLSNCNAAADKAHADYLELMQKLMPLKRKVQLPVPQALQDEAATLAAHAKSLCSNQLAELKKKNL